MSNPATYVIAGLIEIELPGHAIRLVDGGFLVFDGHTFICEDPVFGTIGAVGEVSESIDDEAPSWSMTLLPPMISAASELYRPDAQGAPVRAWLADVDPATGTIIGTPDLQFSGFTDTLGLRLSKSGRSVELGFVSEADRLFWTMEGNVLSDGFHQAVFPGETGLARATGVPFQSPWGVAGAPRGSISTGSGIGGVAGVPDIGKFNYIGSFAGVA